MNRAAAVVLLLVLAGCSDDSTGDPTGLGTPSSAPQPSTQVGEPRTTLDAQGPRVVGTIATGLQAPWGVTFLPDGTALVGERDTTRVVAIAPSGRLREVGRIALAVPEGESGLLGLATSPSYDEDGLVFAYVTTRGDNRVVKMAYDGRSLGDPVDVLTGIPNGFIHDGGRLLFDADGNIFVSTGEIGEPERAQDRGDLGGKILHITPDGDPAPDNPIAGSPVWTMGHRNVQGLAFDDSGQLWASEFGQNTWDELNRIDAGRNYGWPVHEGRGDDKGYRDPYVQWRTSEASPSGLAFLDGALWAASLRGERLWRIPVTDDGVGKVEDFFVGDYGRLRTVVVAPDGNLWVTTSNRDGRGDPRAGDDRILVVAP
ncbi:MAG TPA: PQQ-dependent sugar dehydrogenase [Nocardioidaceae bacterium]|nr:PQQ-dependent sugar dehydrogenase [Nocardioidaceae bacterium]